MTDHDIRRDYDGCNQRINRSKRMRDVLVSVRSPRFPRDGLHAIDDQDERCSPAVVPVFTESNLASVKLIGRYP